MSFLDPSPIFLAFIFVQRFVYFELLALLALLRLLVGRGPARVLAALVLALCVAAIATTFAPAMNLQSSGWYATGARILAAGGGIAAPLVTSALFATSLVLSTRRWRWIDLTHLAALVVFLGLWVATKV